MPVSAPFNGICYISAASPPSPQTVCHAEGVQSSSPPTQLTAGRGSGKMRVGRDEKSERSATFCICSMDWIGYSQGETSILLSDLLLQTHQLLHYKSHTVVHHKPPKPGSITE